MLQTVFLLCRKRSCNLQINMLLLKRGLTTQKGEIVLKILITDYADELNSRNLEYEKALFKQELGDDTEVEIHPYESEEALIARGMDADGILTAFITFKGETLLKMKKLKAISVNATGYNFIDIDTASERGICVCAIGEYCTKEVADQTIGMMLALIKNLKYYDEEISKSKKWIYSSIDPNRRTEKLTLGIVGFGKIGKAVAVRAKVFGMRILANDPLLSREEAEACGVQLADVETILEESDVITNHMDANHTNIKYFNMEKFERMKRKPVFLNLARGVSMDEGDLAEALDRGLLRGAGLDVLGSEEPDLQKCRLTERANVIISPHSAFYSKEAFEDLQNFSCYNLIYCLRGEKDKVFKLVNRPE